MKLKIQFLLSALFLLFIFFFSSKSALAANYTFTVSNYHLDTTSRNITFTASNPSTIFDDTDRSDVVVTSAPFDITDSAVLYRTNWPNNPNCNYGTPQEYSGDGYYCSNNTLTAVNPNQNGGLYICIYSEFDNNTYCSQEINSLDLFANITQATMDVSNYHLNTSTDELTFTASHPDPLFDDTDRIDIFLTNTPLTTDPKAITPTDAFYSSYWPNNPSCTYGQVGNYNNTGFYCTDEALNSTSTSPTSTVYLCLYSEFNTRMYCSQSISYFDLVTNIPSISYFNTNDGTNFSRSLTPFTSGVATQAKNSNGSITVNINNASGYADSGFDIYEGTLGNLPNFSVNGSGDQYGLNIWLDTNNDNDYFTWSSNVLASLSGDTYALGPGSSNGSLSIDGNSQFYLMSDGQNHTLSDLKNGLVSGITSNTHVAIWIGVNVNSGSTSSTINSISGL